MKEHTYSVEIEWTGNTGQGTANYRAYQRNYAIKIEGKPDIMGSADPSFLGDKNRQNPEELFVASISSCHMLWYLHLCSQNGITIVDYYDPATGVMREEKEGAGCFESVTLKPHVTILEPDRLNLAEELHAKANKMCFIANSCNFEVRHEPVIKIPDR